MRSKSAHQPKPRNRGSSPRAKMERQVETTILSSSNPRVKVGERAKLQLMDDGSLRLLLLEQMGMARTHGRKVEMLAQNSGWSIAKQEYVDECYMTGIMDNGYSDYGYFIPWEAYAEVKGEAP